ncbi:DUF6153 family protein [Streptomyces cucumeris]|uniref:DUF6153 family protein n=1 Tax=Streptomyces cucumeris TaxID=2962890 RepID=UPI003EB7E616
MNIGGRVYGGVVPRLLLMVVLAMGVMVMHTLGHPDGDSGSGAGGPAHHAAVAPHASPGHGGSPGHGRATSHHGGHHRVEPAVAADAAPLAEPREPLAMMDMASLCVAVLGVWVLMSLLCAALTSRRGPPPEAGAPPGAAVRLRPPPPGPDLVALSVLRI